MSLSPSPKHSALDNNLKSGYIMAIMRFKIILAPEAVQDLKRLDAHTRAKAKDLIDVHLRHEPAKGSKSRIKRLRGLRHPQCRLRVDDIRIFYDIEASRVEILAILSKSDAMKWLEDAGEEL